MDNTKTDNNNKITHTPLKKKNLIIANHLTYETLKPCSSEQIDIVFTEQKGQGTVSIYNSLLLWQSFKHLCALHMSELVGNQIIGYGAAVEACILMPAPRYLMFASSSKVPDTRSSIFIISLGKNSSHGWNCSIHKNVHLRFFHQTQANVFWKERCTQCNTMLCPFINNTNLLQT